MKKIISLLIVAILLCSVLAVPTTVSAAASKGVKEEYLNSDKWLTLSKNTTGPRYFVNSKGQPVELFGHHRYQGFRSMEDTAYSTTEGLDGLMKVYRDYGVNFIRLGIEVNELCNGKKKTAEEINDVITRSIDPDVQTIIRNGMYVMLDIHMYPPEECKTAEATVKYARDYYLPLLKELAKKYKDEPMVGAIEIWNEPVAVDREQITFEPDTWKKELRQYFIDAVNEIRKIDTKHVILVSDSNAGWGEEIPKFWGGYYDKVDPVYRNTCFSVHAAHEQLDFSFEFYSKKWKSWAKDNNLCLLFGELETVSGISTRKGIQNLCDFLSETKKEYHFSGALWGPHSGEAGYFDIWADSGWVDSYCGSDPVMKTRYVTEAEDAFGDASKVAETTKDATFFGTKESGSTAISLNKGLGATAYQETTSEALNNVVYKAGKYKLMVRAAGKSGYAGDFIVGYRDVDGTIHQIARFAGKNTNMAAYYQTVEFTAAKQIASFVFFGCDSTQKSALIDRIYIESATKDKAVATRSKVDIADASKIIDLNGKTLTITTADNNTSKPSDGASSEKPAEKEENKEEEKDNNTENTVDVESNVPDENKTTTETKTETTTEKTSEKNDLTIYIIIAGGILLALAAFVVVVVVVTKKKKVIIEEPKAEE